VFSTSKPSLDSPWSAEYGNGGARALSTSARRDTSRSLGVPSFNDPNDFPISSSAHKRLLAPLGSIEQQVGNMSIGERQAVSKAEFHSKRWKNATLNNDGYTSRDSAFMTGRSTKWAEHPPVDNEIIMKTSSNIRLEADYRNEPTGPSCRPRSVPSSKLQNPHPDPTTSELDKPKADVSTQTVKKAWNHSSSVQARAKQAQSLDSFSSFPDAKMPNKVSKRQTQVLPESQRKSYSRLKARPVQEDKASAEVLVRKGQNYLNLDLSPDLNPIRRVQQGYTELQNSIVDILRKKYSRNFRYIELRLGDARDRIRFMKRDIGRYMRLYRGVWYMMKQAEQIRGLQGADRIKHQRIFNFNVSRTTLVEPSASLANSQSQIYHCGYELIETRIRRGMGISPNLCSIRDLCDITATQLKPVGHYNNLLITRYFRQNNGEDFANIWLHIQDVYRTSQELYRKMEYLLHFWDRPRLKRYDGWRRNDRHQSRRMALTRMIVVMFEYLEESKAALWAYHNMMLHQWASATPDSTAGTITGVHPADRRDRSDEGNREVRKQILDTTDHESLLDRNVSLELSHAEALRHFPTSGLTTGLSMRPTQMLSQQYVQSTDSPALSTPDDFLRTNSKIASFATPGSDSCSQPHALNDFAEAANTALHASKAAAVEVLKEPWPQLHLSPLGYHIPEKNMADAKSASPGTRASYWQYLLYRGPNGEKIKVHYCKSKATTERIAQLFLNEEIVGFDIEWKPQALATEGVKKNVALIQLASEERVALFHIARYWEDEKSEDLLAPTLKKIMESTKITKVGVSVKADCTRLRKFMGIDSRGLFELSHLYKLVKFSPVNVKMINKTLVSLSRQVEEHLHLPMWKGEVRSSDWSQELNYEQIYCK